jgi:TPR repeat protein
MDIEEKRRKAEAGSCVAQTILGISYLYGYDVEVDYKEAFRFLSSAATQGTSRAVLNLGIMHAKGLGIPQNIPEAIRLLETVAEPSDSSDAFAARIELARLYSSGLSFPVDPIKALRWYKEAIALASDDEESEDLREARDFVARVNNGR